MSSTKIQTMFGGAASAGRDLAPTAKIATHVAIQTKRHRGGTHRAVQLLDLEFIAGRETCAATIDTFHFCAGNNALNHPAYRWRGLRRIASDWSLNIQYDWPSRWAVCSHGRFSWVNAP